MAEHTPNEPRRVKTGLIAARPRSFVLVYALLVIASNIVDHVLDTDRLFWGNLYMEHNGARQVEIPTQGLPIRVDPLTYSAIVHGGEDDSKAPVLLIHGSPGGAIGFAPLAPVLAQDARAVISYDLPGFASQSEPLTRGRVFDDYSSATYAEISWRLLDELGYTGRVHIVGWSNGGAVGLRMIEDDPGRVASLTLLAAVGAQENEGTGSYAFEHFKYKAGYVLLVHGSRLIPHFGALGPASERNGFLRFFDDTDQRDLGAFMESIDTPTMVMHGRHDFLIPDRAAEDHHARMPTSRLVMLDAMHFIPMLHADTAASYLTPFFERHDTPGIAPETGVIDEAPVPTRTGFHAWIHGSYAWFTTLPLWIQIAACVLVVRFGRTPGALLVLVGVGWMRLDFAVALIALFTGRTWYAIRAARGAERPWTTLGWVRRVASSVPLFVLGVLAASPTETLTRAWGAFGFVLSIALASVLISVVMRSVTRTGRALIRADARCLVYYEYWPTWAIYLPMLVRTPVWALKHGGYRVVTACNPGYADDGGVIDERKSVLQSRFAPGTVLHLVECPIDPDAACALVNDDELLGGYPLIAKPDSGQHGVGVRLVRSDDQLRAYLRAHDAPAVLQRYHPGPREYGVLWARDPESIRDPHAFPRGEILGITIKELPVVTGDGRRSIRELILAHSRHRVMHRAFFRAMRDSLNEVPSDGEEVTLGAAANHAQGAIFRDGSYLITPELSGAIDEIALGFSDEHGRGFDIGRFDIRAASDDALARGEHLGVIELNGVASEPTQLYDPDRSYAWAARQIVEYWRRAADLGAARIATKTGERAPLGTVLKKFLTNLDKFW